MSPAAVPGAIVCHVIGRLLQGQAHLRFAFVLLDGTIEHVGRPIEIRIPIPWQVIRMGRFVIAPGQFFHPLILDIIANKFLRSPAVHSKVVQSTGDLHHKIVILFFRIAENVFDNATSFHPSNDMLNHHPDT
jgi:hypothetical protein